MNRSELSGQGGINRFHCVDTVAALPSMFMLFRKVKSASKTARQAQPNLQARLPSIADTRKLSQITTPRATSTTDRHRRLPQAYSSASNLQLDGSHPQATMATNHQPFPARTYNTNLPTRPTQPYNNPNPYGATNTSTPFAPPQPQPQPQPQQTHQQREASRLEAQRQERLERERREAAAQQLLDGLSDEAREEIDEAFRLFDLDRDDHIDYHELKVALKALGFDLPKTEILAELQAYGIPASQVHGTGNGKAAGGGAVGEGGAASFLGPGRLLLPHAAFVNLAAVRITERNPQDEIMRAFDLFDQEGKGRIELEDLRRVARELGEGLQDEELVAMIEEFDIRGEGGIDRDAFMGICLGT
jgi:centrin-3